jgi:hypothetical protein
MKIFAIFALVLFSQLTQSAVAEVASPGVLWSVSVEESGLVSSVYSSKIDDLVCTQSFAVSLFNSFGLFKAVRNFEFGNYILPGRQIATFRIDLKNMDLPEGLILGELLSIEPLKCVPYQKTLKEVALAVEGALRNSDEEAAAYFLALLPNRDKLKVLDVSNSVFNVSEVESKFGLNFIEKTNTTFSKKHPNSEDLACSVKKSIKCGFEYFVEDSKNCEPELFNEARDEGVCGCEKRSKDRLKCLNGCPCDRAKLCRNQKFGVEKYKSCAHPNHGNKDVLSCPLKLNENGVLESCQL